MIGAADVDRVETTHSTEQQAGDELFARGDFRAALSRYRSALEASREPRQWMRRQILVQIVWCQRDLGEWDQAGEHFLILLASDPATDDFDCIPLVWTDAVPTAAVARKAEAWLDADQPAAVLMGASQLLTTERRAAVVAALKRLLSQPDRRIAWFAFAQLWRAGSTNATPQQWASFTAKIDTADESLRAGAYYTLGTALETEDPQAAALALLKVPLLYPREYDLSARSLLAAGRCLQADGRLGQAAGLYRELLDRFGESNAADEARRRLASLASDGSPGDN